MPDRGALLEEGADDVESIDGTDLIVEMLGDVP